LGLPEMLSTTIQTIFPGSVGTAPHEGLVRRAVQARLIVYLAAAMADKSLSPTAAAVIQDALTDLGRQLKGATRGDAEDLAQARYYAEILLGTTPDRFKVLVERDAGHAAPPPGMPIGGGEDDWFAGSAW
jgi:hypothetical protein